MSPVTSRSPMRNCSPSETAMVMVKYLLSSLSRTLWSSISALMKPLSKYSLIMMARSFWNWNSSNLPEPVKTLRSPFSFVPMKPLSFLELKNLLPMKVMRFTRTSSFSFILKVTVASSPSVVMTGSTVAR